MCKKTIFEFLRFERVSTSAFNDFEVSKVYPLEVIKTRLICDMSSKIKCTYFSLLYIFMLVSFNIEVTETTRVAFIAKQRT